MMRPIYKTQTVNWRMKVWRIKAKSQIQTSLWLSEAKTNESSQQACSTPAGSTGQMVRALQEFKEHLIWVLT